jgi:hypothetical protein
MTEDDFKQGRAKRIAVTLFVAMLLGAGLGEANLSFGANLLAAGATLAIFTFLFVPWVILGHGWIWIWKNRQ